MVIRRLGPIVIGIAISLAGPAVPSLADGPGPVVAVADGTTSGTIIATLNVDPATAPYLSLVLIRPSGAPNANRVELPVVPNTGPGMTQSVETWGLDGGSELAVEGCYEADCSAIGDRGVLGTADFTATPPEVPTGTIDAPTSPFIYPDQGTPTITADSEGAGGRRAWGILNGSGLASLGPLDDDTPTAVDLSSISEPDVTLALLECSKYGPLERGAALCTVVDSQPVTAVTRVATRLDYQPDFTGVVITDPSLYGASARLEDDISSYDPDLPYTASWTLTDSSGTTVLGPTSFTINGATTDFQLDPEQLAASTLPTGAYTLTMTTAVTIAGDSRHGTATKRLFLESNPGVAPVPVPDVVDHRLRFAPTPFEGSDTDTEILLPAMDRLAGPSIFEVRNAKGKVVFTQTDGPLPRSESNEWQAKYDFDFAGYPIGGGYHVPAGIYHATATIPDQWGRPVVIDLGAIQAYGSHELQQRWRTSRPAIIRAPEHGSRSRIFTLHVPGRTGTLDMLNPSVGISAGSARDALGVPKSVFSVATEVPGLAGGWCPIRGTQRADTIPESMDAGGTVYVDGRHPLTDPKSYVVRVRITVRDGNAVKVSHFGVRAEWWRWYLPQ